MTDADIEMLVSRKERAIHCRRKTRGVDATTCIIDELIESLDSDTGKDSMGQPLFHHDRIRETWKQQRRHIGCIQDPPGIQLYTKIGTMYNGEKLPRYRCARGST